MSCNAIAVSNSVVNIDEAISKFIPASVLSKAVGIFLRKKFGESAVYPFITSGIETTFAIDGGLRVAISGKNVRVYKEGYSWDTAEIEAEVSGLSGEIGKFIRSLAVAAISGKATTAIKRIGRVTDEKVSPNGSARVISFEI